MEAANFTKLLRIEEFVKSPIATQTQDGLHAIFLDIDHLKSVTVASDPDLRKLYSKYSSSPFTGQSKLPPGSNAVSISVSHSRYLMSRLSTLRAQLHLLYGEISSAIAELRMAAAYCVRSPEACELLGGTLRLSATTTDEMEEAEKWMLRAIEAGKQLEESLRTVDPSSKSMTPAGMYDEQRIASEKRASENAGHRYLLLLCQSRRCDRADEILQSLGYRFRLSEDLLNYFLSVERHLPISQVMDSGELPTMAVCDNAIPPPLLSAMQAAFAPDSSFWRQHFYDPLQSLSRSVGFFSYVYPFRERAAMSVQEQVVDRLRQIAVDMGVDLSQANYAEWWVHSRVHGAGHQMHYDSDEKHIARGGAPRHPLFSCVLYLCEDVGGPTVVTDQKLGGSRGTKSWICMPKMNRLLFFDATYLHGVLPGVGAVPGRRLSFMVGWWPAISSSILTGDKPGAAHCYPPVPLSSVTAESLQGKEEPWFLSHGAIADTSYPGNAVPTAVNVARDVVLSVPSLWTPIGGQAEHHDDAADINDKDYDLLFQGF